MSRVAEQVPSCQGLCPQLSQPGAQLGSAALQIKGNQQQPDPESGMHHPRQPHFTSSPYVLRGWVSQLNAQQQGLYLLLSQPT